MKKPFKLIIVVLLLLGVSAALLTMYIQNHSVPIMEPKGLIAMKERDLIYTSAILMLLVVIPVIIITIVFAWKYREQNERAKHAPDWEHNNIAECCWWGVPVVIVAILAVITFRTCFELDPYKPLEHEKNPIEIQVVALDWKWLFIYPEYGIASVNFFQIPEKTPIKFAITSDAPMNSFWIPALGSQIYAMPAMRTELNLIANEVGSFRGASSNISGKGFAGMYFTVKSSTDEEFERWVSSVKQSSKTLGWDEYNKLAEPSEYHPAVSYILTQPDLFDQIMNKYYPPQK
ncbi:ubiquinol oxidase subunit II [Simkania negevensis]|uniref:Cytochrome c oxidase subunit 2 n=1 Tax=Simkania negevensis (strain ATCC VR-1471 / DSM 27360 / Z) TaxID=331113 RepID=F8L9H3_SIMNZ|nr:ubiquinol oxidase subunit II [Simkania negevensis]CCB89510.1 ubiquinol oxidase subunit 2 [Simkania negevensis Z]